MKQHANYSSVYFNRLTPNDP